jgi:hypothetical protein
MKTVFICKNWYMYIDIFWRLCAQQFAIENSTQFILVTYIFYV